MLYSIQYFIQHCFSCRPSGSIVSEDVGIEPGNVEILALAVRRSNNSRLDIIHKRLYIYVLYCESRKELAHTMVRQLILFSKITGALLFRTFGGFLHVPTTQIQCLTGAIISETRIITNIYLKYYVQSSVVSPKEQRL